MDLTHLGRLSVLSLSSLALVASLTAAAPAAAPSAFPPDTCRGEPATIVGTTGEVVGTEGRDVIVATNGTWNVRALGGDDLVCLVSAGTGSTSLRVDAGSGDDVVDSTGAGRVSQVGVDLGPGADLFIGGDGSDSVMADGEGAAEDDVIRTGAGDDHVVSGVVGHPNGDTLDLGHDDDRVALLGSRLTGPPVLGGGGETHLELRDPQGSYHVDVAAGLVSRDGADWAWFEGLFSTFEMKEPPTGFSFEGTGRHERVIFRGDYAGSPRTIEGRGGDDGVYLSSPPLPGEVFRGGRGEDFLLVAAPGTDLSFDLPTGDLLLFPDSDPVRVTAPGFEGTHLMGRRVDVRGTKHDNTLFLTGCRLSARGGKGADWIQRKHDDFYDETERYSCPRPVRAWFRGGRGHDHLRGSAGPDVLIGGRGRDEALGQQGRDVCRAEKKRGCER